MTNHKEIVYWSAVINHAIPIPAGSRVSVTATPDRSDDELLLIVNGKVYGCLVKVNPEDHGKVIRLVRQ